MHVHWDPFTRTLVRENQLPFPVSEALVCQAVDLSVWFSLFSSQAQNRTSRLGPPGSPGAPPVFPEGRGVACWGTCPDLVLGRVPTPQKTSTSELLS